MVTVNVVLQASSKEQREPELPTEAGGTPLLEEGDEALRVKIDLDGDEIVSSCYASPT